MPGKEPKDLIERFASQVAIAHDQEAVRARDGSLTYGQLDMAADALAHSLLERGVGPEQVVPLLVPRTCALPVGILGILKAGAAYLPLESSHPGSRLAHLVRQAAAQTLVTTADLAGRARDRVDTRSLSQVIIETTGSALTRADGTAAVSRRASSLAYVLPTSGSTGDPKGVQIEDRHVLGLVKALDESILRRLGPSLRIGLVAPSVFDASVQQIFSALLLGHTLVIVPEDVRADGGRLRHFWSSEHIDVCDGTPAHLKMISKAHTAPLVTVRHLIIGGDVMTKDTLTAFYGCCTAQPPGITNIYGVSECCVDSVAGLVDPSSPGDPPIGSSLPGAIVDVLGDDLNPVPGGEIGEICIGGVGVGRGYHGDPVLTAQRFVPSPRDPGQRMYRTGDAGRRRENGDLIFIQRQDRQLKIRGHRIEPLEIENALRRYRVRVAGNGAAQPCERCLLTTAYPGVTVTDGVCSECVKFENCRDAARAYFRTPEELVAQLTALQGATYDVMLLFSGGKDSTYVLYRLLDLGLRVFAFTFDNGYISGTAFRNIKRITGQLGVDLEIGRVPAMNEVFKESLRADSTVCSGCFRGLTTLSTNIALDRGIPAVITGLSRGQIYETKLRMLFEAGIHDPDEVDRRLMGHRKLYQARRDRTAELIGPQVDQSAIDSLLFADYFRYNDVQTSQVKEFLAERDEAWKNPGDTGLCSTNCRINDVGIYVHSLERGFHNYASPLSWDCRLGVVSREQGLRELSEVMPRNDIIKTLERLGYTPSERNAARVRDAVVVARDAGDGDIELCAYYSGANIQSADLRAYLKRELPSYMIPDHFIHLDEIPVTDIGKVNYAALPARADVGSAGSEGPRNEAERRIVRIWTDVLKIGDVTRDADFFELGGNSLRATVVAGMIEQEFGVSLPVADLFSTPTVASNAELVSGVQTGELGG